MACAGNNLKRLGSPQAREDCLVQGENFGVGTAYDQKSGRPDPWQDLHCKVWASAPGNDRLHPVFQFSGGSERGRGAGACTEKAKV